MDVVKLQKTPCLFEAYEHVLSLLEKVFTPMFCHSDEVRKSIPPNTSRNQFIWTFSTQSLLYFQYFRYLLKGAESPTRSSRISR